MPAPNWTTLYVFPFFFGWFFQTNTRGLFAAACCCCIFAISLFFTFLSSPKCMRKGHMVVVCILDQRSGAAFVLLYKNKSDGCASSVVPLLIMSSVVPLLIMYSYIFLKQGGDYIVHSPRYVKKQSTPTTTPVVCTHLLRHPLLMAFLSLRTRLRREVL